VAGDKDAAKRRRQARNRQEREKRQQRTEAVRRPSRTADAAPPRRSTAKAGKGAASGRASGGRDTATAGARPQGGGLLGTLFPPRPQPAGGAGGRPSRAQPTQSVPVDVGDVHGARGAFLRLSAQPGGRAALLALMVAVVAAITLFATPNAPLAVLDGYGEMAVEASHQNADVAAARVGRFEDADPVLERTFLLNVVPAPVAVVLAIVPVAIAAFAVSALTKPTRSRTLLIASLLAAMYFFFAGQLNPTFVIGVFALGWAAWKSRKADIPIAADDAADDDA